MEKLKAGDVVKLNSGGPIMTVIRRGNFAGNREEDTVRCVWFQEGKPQHEDFPDVCLTKTSNTGPVMTRQ